MRAKNILALVPVPTFIKLLYQRITVSRIAFFYFTFSLVYCISQLVFQGWAFKINSDAGIFLQRIIFVSGINENLDIPAYDRVTSTTAPASQGGVAPTGLLSAPTSILTYTSTSTSSTPSVSSSTSSSASSKPTPSSPARPIAITNKTRTASNLRIEDDDSRFRVVLFTKRGDGIIQDSNGNVFVPNLSRNGQSGVNLTQSCVEALILPVQTIHNHKREDITFMAFQVWVMGMAVIALLNESIPHIIAVVITHLLATAWSGFRIFNTNQFREDFQETTTKPDSCGVNLLRNYWSQRNPAEIAILAINAAFLISAVYFTCRLVKRFGWQTFKRIGASLEINRVYKIVLTFSIGLELAFFSLLASMGLWLDELLNTYEGQLATHLVLYKTIAIIVCVLVIPWMYLGWTSVRKESKVLMGIFIAVSITTLAGWGAIFLSNTFRGTFVTWPFFAGICTASISFTVMCTILGALCLGNFDKGLKNFLNAEERIPGDSFTPATPDLEKSPMIQFPPAAAAQDVIFSITPDRYSPEGLQTVFEYDQTSVGSGGSIRRPPPVRVPTDGAFLSSEGLKRSGSTSSDYSTYSSNHSTESGVVRTYAVAGSHHALLAAHQKQGGGSSSSNAKRGWVIE